MNFQNSLKALQGMEEDIEFMPLITLEEEGDGKKDVFADVIPVLPLRNTVLFPGVVIPITVGRDKSIKAVRDAYAADRFIGVIAQLDSNVEEPEFKDLHKVGTMAKILKMLKMPDGSTTAIIQGKVRFSIREFIASDPYFKATIDVLSDIPYLEDKQFEAMVSSLKEMAGNIIKLSPNIPTEASIMLRNIDSPGFLINFIANNLSIELKEKQKVLELNDLKERAQAVLVQLESEIQVLELKNKIQSKVRSDIEKQQKDYFLQQQLKTIQEELGSSDSIEKEIQNLRDRAAKKKWTKPVAEHFEKEVSKLQRMNPAAAEHGVILNYLELLLDLPWGVYTKDKFDLKRAKKILEQDHYGLEKVKDRILEYLAVLKLKGDLKSPILCFVGPPGVGKTSLGKSIGKALNRKYVRMSLGGLHDEAEIRGHRKTYIGAMPGRIIQSLKKAQTSNPVFVLDEIDKVGADFRGDPSSALLEVLDPEQNNSFYDQYVELEYDLSKVLFIATANSLATIQPALRDRMEIIDISGYSVEEKIQIAERHLIPKQLEAHGLKNKHVHFSKPVIQKIIEDYTRESGVRDLDRKLAGVMRSIAKDVALNERRSAELSLDDIKRILGIKRFDAEMYQEENPPGVAIGLAWTYVGGEILYVETLLSKGKGNLKLTGNLGDVMKESASTALTFIKSHADKIGIKQDDLDKKDIHIHVPEGAIPKDGPSAGVTMLSAIASAFSGRKVKKFLAMTGEITLRGKVLPVGGIKEKILAAKRAGMKEILLCRMNEKDISEINPEFIKGIVFHYVDDMMQVLEIALVK
ncbi:MAG: endopeptidase La [Chitinophagales bacterium]|nr:endopeptidase La [Chitinophagaceae bacterium]MBP9884286.1 endopeptidase La [Chitinophagales bacterium]